MVKIISCLMVTLPVKKVTIVLISTIIQNLMVKIYSCYSQLTKCVCVCDQAATFEGNLTVELSSAKQFQLYFYISVHQTRIEVKLICNFMNLKKKNWQFHLCSFFYFFRMRSNAYLHITDMIYCTMHILIWKDWMSFLKLLRYVEACLGNLCSTRTN